MLGKLSRSVIPIDQPIPLIAAGVVLATIIAVLLWVLIKGCIPYLWREWITSDMEAEVAVEHQHGRRCRQDRERRHDQQIRCTTSMSSRPPKWRGSIMPS
jgi:hypothetical protein